jgi:FtsZ-interacting cell division protein ZipA
VKSNRRAGTLRPKDYDHEIDLIDHDGSASRNQDRPSNEDTVEVSRSSTNAELLQHRGDGATTDEDRTNGSPTTNRTSERPRSDAGRPSNGHQHEAELAQDALRPSISVQEASPNIFRENNPNVKPKKPRVERETVIDILYENERGGFLCGAALFSAAALGGLDATPWSKC